MKKKFLRIVLTVTVLIGAFSFHSCDEETVEKTLKIISTLNEVLEDVEDYDVLWGWNEGSENMAEIESDISFGTAAGSSSLPATHNIEQHYPPIGNQGPYGTCVAWAVGYNMRTYMNSYFGGGNPSQKSDQFSPKDLFWAINNTAKGDDCGGTSFEAAMDVLVSRGVADLNTVPYDQLGDCSDSPEASWDDVAENYKIANYRKIGAQNDIDVDLIKDYLANNRPVVIGAKLGDNFMDWSSSNEGQTLSSETYDYAGQHAYHAMVLGGYDDNRNAFKVVNSWATSWGVDGNIWIDYDFFADEFCFAAFVANSVKDDPDEDDDNEVDDVTDGDDLTAWELVDMDYEDPDYPEDSNDPRWRTAKYNVFNSGENTINASEDWNILVIYYNAYDAEDYGILLFDVYTDDYGSPGEDGELSGDDAPDYQQRGSWWNHYDIPSGKSVASIVYGEDDVRFTWSYEMPEISGDYYLVTIADGFDVINEEDEENNYYYLTNADGGPLTYDNGILQTQVAKSKAKGKPGKFAKSPSQTAVNKVNPNTYTPEEIMTMLEHHRESGELKRRVKEFLKNKGKSVDHL